MAMDYQAEQPNINALANGLGTAADEEQKIDNLPQFQQGNAILQSLEGLQKQMQQFQQQMQTMQDVLERRLDARCATEQRVDLPCF